MLLRGKRWGKCRKMVVLRRCGGRGAREGRGRMGGRRVYVKEDEIKRQ
jgi:hypothetical protein